ncbi:MAG: hypothetical protein PUE35_04440 [Bacteroidales bacterium]|nr:hypothetical protein [Bacteroidales bacterium]
MIRLYKEYAIGVKKLSEADLGWETSSSSQTHIGLSEQVFTFLPNSPDQRDGILIYNRSCSSVECAFSKIGKKRSTKVDTTTTTPIKSVVRQIRNIASDSNLEWYLVWFALDNQVPIFWLINSLSDDFAALKDITSLDFSMKVFKCSTDDYFKILSLIRSISKLETLISQKFDNSEDNLLIAVSNEHRTFVHLVLDYFRAKHDLDVLYDFFNTVDNDVPIKVSKEGEFSLLNMFIFASIDEINKRNSTKQGRRWYTDSFPIKNRECYLYVDWYPGKNKNGGNEQLMIPDFVNLIHECYGNKYSYRNSQGAHELWLVNSPNTFDLRSTSDSKSHLPVNTIENLTATPSIWVYSPGEGARKWQECLDENVMLIGWDEMGDFRNYKKRQDIVERLREVYGNTENAYTNDSLAIWQFCQQMRPGDIVYVKRGLTLIVGRGIVRSEYAYNDKRYEYKNSRAVEWTHSGEWEYPKKLPMKTLTRINDYKEMVERLEGLFDPEEKVEQIQFSMTSLVDCIAKTGLLYEDKLIQRYVCSLMTKPFVILSGLAGSGKTQLALAFARAMSENVDQQLCVVPVGADWTNREPLLGYPNALKPGEYMLPESGGLQIMMRALRNPNKPYFLVLDEMNLSYVERYFADFLSALESHQEIPLWEKPDECDSEVPAKIALPHNLFIIGTINVDETTYMFSPKVLDRANVIEFKISGKEMEKFLKQDMNVDVYAANGLCANMAQDFVEKSTRKETDSSELAQKTLIEFFKVLKKVNAEFGYRSATEIYRFIANAKSCAKGLTENEILDASIVQKLLPKLHGSRKKLEPALKALWSLCMENGHTEEAITRDKVEYAKFPEAADKIQRMMQTALDNGFTSFAEA